MMVGLHNMDRTLTNKFAQWGITSPSVVDSTADYNLRYVGADWPGEAVTMIGLCRLDNLEQCIVSVLQRDIPGDLIETGVWRGGASIFMRAVLKACGDTGRKVWLADSFQGLPKPDAETYPADRGDDLWTFKYQIGRAHV